MKQYLNRMTKKTGLPPGDLIHIGPEKTEPIQYTLARYGTHGVEFFDLSSPSDIAKSHPQRLLLAGRAWGAPA